MAMANHRAKARYDKLKTICINIFDFSLIEHELTVSYYIKSPSNSNSYKKYYVAKIKGDVDIPLKKCLEALQVYNTISEVEALSGEFPLLVELMIGENNPWPYEFVLSRCLNAPNQLLVSLMDEDRENAKSFKYKDIVNKIIQNHAHCSGSFIKRQSEIATSILNILNTPSNQLSSLQNIGIWSDENFSDSRKKYIIQLIAFTQIAEANHTAKNSKYHSRTPGMNKLARAAFKEISESRGNFTSFFDPSSTRRTIFYPPMGTDGTSFARIAVKKVEKYGMNCEYMSDDSDIE